MCELDKQEVSYNLQDFNYNIARYLMKRIHPYCKGRILDLGCGIGVFTKLLVDAGFNVIGVDGSKQKIETAKKNIPAALFLVSTFEEFSPDGSFDTIIAKNIIEHLTEEQSKALLKNTYVWLNPGGKLIIYVPNALALHRRIGYYMGLSKSYDEKTKNGIAIGHTQAWTRQKLELELSATRFKVVECKGLFLKPFPNPMMQLINEKICDALFEVAREPLVADLCSGIYLIAEK